MLMNKLSTISARRQDFDPALVKFEKQWAPFLRYCDNEMPVQIIRPDLLELL